jgi:hypothetical protein
MTEGLPLSHIYNLGRLGNAGDAVRIIADADQRAAIAKWSGVLSVERLEAAVELKKLSPTRFGLSFHLLVQVNQACVVTLEPVAGRIDHRFERELHFIGQVRHKADSLGEKVAELVLDADPEEVPDEIQGLHYDLAGPVLEEYTLSLEPYPRRPGVAFAPEPEAVDPAQSPFAVLKTLK